MEHVAWKGHIKPGYKQEYIRRHNEIWPEMVDALKAAGVCSAPRRILLNRFSAWIDWRYFYVCLHTQIL